MKYRVPKLRFPEFSGEWEEKKLENFAEINPKNLELPEEFIYIDLESVEDGLLRKENIISKKEAPSRAQRILTNGDILYQTVRPYQKNNLYFNKENNEYPYVASTGYAQMRTFQNSRYLYHFIHTDKFVDAVLERCTGTSYPAINSTDLKAMNICFPSLPEQQEIASFLSSVDSKIEKLERKKELWEQYKKGMMQKIFSQELRFKDENGEDYPEWEEKSLGEISQLTSSKRVYLSDYVEFGIPFYRGKEISDLKKGNKIDDVLYITEESYNHFKTKYGVPSRGDILITAVGTLGNIYMITSNDPFYFKDGNLIWMKEISENSKFLEYTLEYGKKEILDSSIGSTQKALTIVSLSKLKFNFPFLQEQTKIADFLSSIDSKIEMVGKELDGMKEFKKGLLQQMFV